MVLFGSSWGAFAAVPSVNVAKAWVVLTVGLEPSSTGGLAYV